MTSSNDTPLKIACVAGVGMFLSTLDSGIITIALPTLLTDFHSKISIVVWTITLYMLVLSATILLFGKLADRIGRLKIYAIGLGLFALSSLLCGISTNIWLLITFRAFQGLSAAMMQATAIALITTRLSGNNSVRAMSIFVTLLSLGPVMGPVVGGFIISILSWRWIFLINIPICLLGLYGCTTLSPVKEELYNSKINWLNLVLVGLVMLSALLTITFITNNSNTIYGITSILFAILFVGYVISEIITKNPIIPLGLFKKLKFTAPMLGIIAFGGATAVIFMLPPLYFQKLIGLPVWQVGLISLFAPIGIVSSSRFSSKLVQNMGALKIMLMGIVIIFATLTTLTQIHTDWPIAFIALLLLIYGLGGGLFQVSCYIYITSQFPNNRQAFISSLIRMIQNFAIAIESAGAAILIGLASKHDLSILTGIKHGWWLSAIISFIALVSILICYRIYGISKDS